MSHHGLSLTKSIQRLLDNGSYKIKRTAYTDYRPIVELSLANPVVFNLVTLGHGSNLATLSNACKKLIVEETNAKLLKEYLDIHQLSA